MAIRSSEGSGRSCPACAPTHADSLSRRLGPQGGNAKIITPTVLRTLLAGLVPGRHSCVHQCVVRHMEHLGPIAPAQASRVGVKNANEPNPAVLAVSPSATRPGNLQNEATIIRVERIVAIGRTVSCRERPGGSCEPSKRSHDYRGKRGDAGGGDCISGGGPVYWEIRTESQRYRGKDDCVNRRRFAGLLFSGFVAAEPGGSGRSSGRRPMTWTDAAAVVCSLT